MNDPPAPAAPSDEPALRRTFRSTAPGGLDRRHPVMRLWRLAKIHGTWDPADVDLARDRADWRELEPESQEALERLSALFLAGEESVVLDLLPLLQTVASEGRLEEEMFLTSFLWEEAKHVDLFRRFFDDVAGDRGDLTRFHGPSYERIFHRELPAAMNRLVTDPSPANQARASVTYNMVVEGVLAETGYHSYHRVLEENGILPGTLEAITLVQRDESRHLAYGVFLLSRLVAEHGDPVWEAIEDQMDRLMEPALGVVGEGLPEGEVSPLGLEVEEFAEFATRQFETRMARLERARGRTLAELMGEAVEVEVEAVGGGGGGED